MAGEIAIAVEGVCGVVRLDRPGAINALTTDMVGATLDALGDWLDEDRIKAVLIEGAGDRGFCAGGDVRRVRDLMLAGDEKEAKGFFAEEYAMNRLIATYPKPVIALQHGIVMGGGIGISSHARYRVATTDARFAMPEPAIGFFADVGVNAILYKTTQARALAFLLSGETVGAGDAIALGLCDAAVAPGALAVLRGRLIEAAQAADPDTAIVAILQGASVDPGPAHLCALADTLAPVFEKRTVFEMIEALLDRAEEGDPGAAAFHAQLSAHCPTSLAAIMLSHRRARGLRAIGPILDMDLALSDFMVSRQDFCEGVRAVLVDKDRTARWRPDTAARVDMGALEAAIAGARAPG